MEPPAACIVVKNTSTRDRKEGSIKTEPTTTCILVKPISACDEIKGREIQDCILIWNVSANGERATVKKEEIVKGPTF
jgi:hypothetical protein